ncbi:MAG: hypothetical protein LBE81_03485 [Azonexus sp.]|jgi:type II secretory pathway pseudopilin PulG|uniref:hypothetical protein n=1 Tax=Azonexus sp. TaxID=1872668 RepID=UPI00281C578C|nr:hypothetical protein [Azonexus sp.]MDR0775686.1 hypothetical protein [Azonexus sp.]
MPLPTKHGQRGFALLLFAFLVLGIGAALFLSAWDGTRARQERERNAAQALQQAKEALIGHAAMPSDINSVGYLPLPDTDDPLLKEGSAAGNPPGNYTNYSIIGKLPWRSLRTPPLRDQHGECLWYIVSGRFKKKPKTDAAFNWDTQGQIEIIDGNGTLIASNIAAVVVAPGPPLDGQSRSLADAAFTQCGGNYQAYNYLDPINAANAVAGEVNYFAGSINGLVAPNDSNKKFIMASGSPFINDRFLLITVDEIFRPIIRRSDFAARISDLLNDPTFVAHLQSLEIKGPKGTAKLDCNKATAPPETSETPDPSRYSSFVSFCNNWKEMFFITQLRDDKPRPPNCSRVIIFAGQKKPNQNRIPPNDEKKENYLEGVNLAAFDTPKAESNDFDIALLPAFVPDEPWKDIVICIPEKAPPSETIE